MTAAVPAHAALGSRPRRFAGGAPEWLLLFACSAVLAGVLATAELGLRAASPDEFAGPEAMTRLHRPSERYGWEPRPGFAGVVQGARTTITRLGARGPGPLPGDAAARRVLVLGDSIAFGWGVHDEQTFAALLDADPALAVTNLAVEGYGLDQALLRFEREGLALRPQVVVVNLCVANDLVDAALPTFLYDGATPKPYFRIENGTLVLHDGHLRRSELARALLGLEDRLELVRWLRARRAPPAPPGPHWTEVAQQVMERRAEVLELNLRLLERIAGVAGAAGAEMVLVAHPSQRSYESAAEAIVDEIARTDRLHGVARVDMGAWYRGRGLAFRDVSLDRAGHLSPAGHREVAHALRGLKELIPR